VLARNAAFSEAHAPEATAFYQRDGPPELRRPQRGHVTAGPRAENQAVDGIALIAGYHCMSSTFAKLGWILDELAQGECEAQPLLAVDDAVVERD
jgi:hypothetical protein